MTGLDLLLGMCERGVIFGLDADRAVTAIDPRHTVTPAERRLLAAVKFELRALLLTELPDDPGTEVCDEFEAAEGCAFCRNCAGGVPAHFWKRRASRCDFAIGDVSEPCRRCGLPVVEHYAAQ